jgi:predicted ATP-grasp superfamily ATP-dependent carboligase
MKESLPAVILSGGSEIVALSVAESLRNHSVPLIVIGLGRPSLIRGFDGVIAYHQLAWPPASLEQGIETLLSALRECPGYGERPWPTFATEDGGLRLLLEGLDPLSPNLAIPRARRLNLGGLDKAELFNFLKTGPCADYLPRTRILDDPDTVREALDELGDDAVFKPALKPFGMDLKRLQGKVIARVSPAETDTSLLRRLRLAWPLSQQWIAQERLLPSSSGEPVWYGARSRHGEVRRILAMERWKQPKEGGSACWVTVGAEVDLDDDLDEIGCALAEEIGLEGLMEMAFLFDQQGQPRLLETNPRAWLQVGLADFAGAELIYSTYCTLSGTAWREQTSIVRGDTRSWVNVERILLAAWQAPGKRAEMLHRALRIIREADYPAVYHTRDTRLIARWLGRMAGTVIRH